VITPRLYLHALGRPLRWRLLLVFWAAVTLPGAIAALPAFLFLRRELDHLPGARELVAALDGNTFLDLVKQLHRHGTLQALAAAGGSAALVALLLSPLIAGATVASARSDETLPLHRLLGAAAELYGRMARAMVAGLIPLGIAGGLTALAFRGVWRANQRATTETAADRHWIAVSIASAILLVFAHLVVDAARARFGAEPARRSALAALWAGFRLVLRQPSRSLALGAIGVAVGIVLPLLLMALRLQVRQAGPGRVALAWLLAQAAQIAVFWGRAVRLFGLVELTRTDLADLSRAAVFRMEPPVESPPAVAPAAGDALEPPPSGAAR